MRIGIEAPFADEGERPRIDLPAVRVPGFPANAMLITRLDNLSIYWQDGTHRRHVEEVPKRDRIENYESINEDYVVEDYGCGCLIENIEVTAGEDDASDKAELSKFTSAIVDAIKTASGTTAPAAQE